jgi:putative ABC transport system substrate-binding protein
MRRREFIALLGGAAATSSGVWTRAARAQKPAVPEIGILNSVALGPMVDRVEALLESLEDSGFVYGQNLAIEYRSAEGQGALLPELAADLVARNPQAIVCLTAAITVHAARAATSTIPIVFAVTGDPVELGLVANPKRPEANVTGAARSTDALNPERLKVICELVPQSRPVAFLVSTERAAAAPTNARIRQMEEAAHAIGRQLIVLDLAGSPALDGIFASMAQQGIAAFVISSEALFNVWRDEIVALSARYAIAAMFPNREYTLAGGLISYGADLYEHYRVAGTYTGRILKGEKPADLPVQIPTKFEMVINRKTAKALGLAVPQALLQAATEVIE